MKINLANITPEMAVAFENVTKIPANFWINRQCIYDKIKHNLKTKQYDNKNRN